MSSAPTFKPKAFSKLGKSQKDFFKKKFTAKKEFTIKTSADSGRVDFESTIEAAKGNTFQGKLKVTNDLELPGKVEVELDTKGAVKASVTLDKVADGAKLKIEGTQKPDVELTADYAKDSFNTTATVSVSQKTTAVDLAGVVGFDGLSVGGHVKYDTASQQVDDYNAVTEYAGPDFVATVQTQDSADSILASYLHDLNHDTSVGARFNYNLTDGSRTLTFGAAFRVDRDTSTKVKADSTGKIDFVVEQSIANPNLTYVFGASWDANKKTTSPETFGVGFTFGK
uniref:Porin domain-containing protein n=1 Tax=Coccolithus braarudii TaxID=221442 RepID=A0A7S0L5C9_9EUKA|mmetsp:Transcript_2136/g.4454  ORF Transcript_2136/g.4454 Transcript_2136/m.4454 type:complete len:283 (+) Transcript_2136:64-912(+)|eukprot:CAMPEP_0183353192 /NCGR_PEP_ID=MMETSP0164_2-20130417/33118_1 /TAXON_ID=221442 /ORGANISM="Coccolithus pelagicus ssp braarudi, Strain PLY182g" /LENGTH=282 /DNA_ID=CAMNT_0025525835 /DNA_START=64 /DNA_END=912 /DNA_ORIENTATION=+